jgi:hypothetical protein
VEFRARGEANGRWNGFGGCQCALGKVCATRRRRVVGVSAPARTQLTKSGSPARHGHVWGRFFFYKKMGTCAEAAATSCEASWDLGTDPIFLLHPRGQHSLHTVHITQTVTQFCFDNILHHARSKTNMLLYIHSQSLASDKLWNTIHSYNQQAAR